MRFVTVAGPPSVGKTSVILRAIEVLAGTGVKVGVVKFDCISTRDRQLFERAGVPVAVGLAGNLCPDHFFVVNVQESLAWGKRAGLDLLVCESAGLCNRCAPHIRDVLAVCVVDHLAGVETPQKIGPMLTMADVVVLTKGDIVSQAEREVFSFRVRQANPRAVVVPVNGLTGQGGDHLARLFREAAEVPTLEGAQLRFSMPAALCSYCLGQRRVGADFQMGNVRKMEFPA
ncbi:GTP-binding protein [Geobacter sp.]|uniref:GTP-binding protein n=1 Tax=Geobacter sp. TaxID=46610 RepID=UPI00262A310E|nr:GTP-binding protein [Geobacter sp.]